ncbi:hypothetical protein RB195_012485 [Necator americanus]|uniref:Uncharacterized protein n=1 Tax=Necator americanus TaxID=51031 RepID=A0ABR1D7B2_NECAM
MNSGNGFSVSAVRKLTHNTLVTRTLGRPKLAIMRPGGAEEALWNRLQQISSTSPIRKRSRFSTKSEGPDACNMPMDFEIINETNNKEYNDSWGKPGTVVLRWVQKSFRPPLVGVHLPRPSRLCQPQKKDETK